MLGFDPYQSGSTKPLQELQMDSFWWVVRGQPHFSGGAAYSRPTQQSEKQMDIDVQEVNEEQSISALFGEDPFYGLRKLLNIKSRDPRKGIPLKLSSFFPEHRSQQFEKLQSTSETCDFPKTSDAEMWGSNKMDAVVYTVFNPEETLLLREWLRKETNSKKCLEENYFIPQELLEKLPLTYTTIAVRDGESIFIPGGYSYQMTAYADAIQFGCDCLSPKNLAYIANSSGLDFDLGEKVYTAVDLHSH